MLHKIRPGEPGRLLYYNHYSHLSVTVPLALITYTPLIKKHYENLVDMILVKVDGYLDQYDTPKVTCLSRAKNDRKQFPE